jgi:hypothetical protein
LTQGLNELVDQDSSEDESGGNASQMVVLNEAKKMVGPLTEAERYFRVTRYLIKKHNKYLTKKHQYVCRK